MTPVFILVILAASPYLAGTSISDKHELDFILLLVGVVGLSASGVGDVSHDGDRCDEQRESKKASEGVVQAIQLSTAKCLMLATSQTNLLI